MRSRPMLLALLLATPALAGCTMPRGDSCGGRPPLLIHPYKDVSDASAVRMDVDLWNCRGGETLVIPNECRQPLVFYPRTTHDNVTYVIGANRSAVPLDRAPCDPPGEEMRVPPGQTSGLHGISWAGWFLLPNGSLVRIPGPHLVQASAGGLRAAGWIDVPREFGDGPADPCVPLRVVTNGSTLRAGERMQVDVAHRACQEETFPTDACGHDLAPRLAVEGHDLVLGADGVARPPEPCPEAPTSQFFPFLAGGRRSHGWNGTWAPEGGEPRAVPPGSYVLRVEFGPRAAEAAVEVVA